MCVTEQLKEIKKYDYFSFIEVKVAPRKFTQREYFLEVKFSSMGYTKGRCGQHTIGNLLVC